MSRATFSAIPVLEIRGKIRGPTAAAGTTAGTLGIKSGARDNASVRAVKLLSGVSVAVLMRIPAARAASSRGRFFADTIRSVRVSKAFWGVGDFRISRAISPASWRLEIRGAETEISGIRSRAAENESSEDLAREEAWVGEMPASTKT